MNTSASAVVNIYTLNLQIKDVCGHLVKGWNRNERCVNLEKEVYIFEGLVETRSISS